MSVVYEFDGFRLDPQRRQLVDQRGSLVDLAPRAFDALHLLVRQPGELVDKRSLRSAIWPTVVVGENSLDQVMSRLRRSLAARGAHRRLIRTERGRGYRFIGEVRAMGLPDAESRTPAPDTAATTRARAQRLFEQALALSVRPSSDNLRAAFELLQTAVELDTELASALGYRAVVRTVFLAFDPPGTGALDAAEAEARRALELDPSVSYGHHALANVCAARGDWNEAAYHYEQASQLELEPHARVSRIYQLWQSAGHLHRSLSEAETIDQRAPTQPLGAIAAALASMLLGRDEEALQHADKASTLGWPRAHPALQDIYFQLAIRRGRFPEAADSMREALSEPMRRAGGTEAVDSLCAALEQPERRPQAVAALRALLERVLPERFGLADRKRVLLWLTLAGAIDDAFAFASATVDHYAPFGMIGASWGLLWMPEMQPFRRDARFASIVARLRLPDFWRLHGPPDGHALHDHLPTYDPRG